MTAEAFFTKCVLPKLDDPASAYPDGERRQSSGAIFKRNESNHLVYAVWGDRSKPHGIGWKLVKGEQAA
jgi:hypothetical protein